MLSIGKILGIFNWLFISIAICLYVLIFFFVVRHRTELKDISLLLTCNTCLSALLTCLTVFIMVASNLFNGFLLFNMRFCLVWGLLYDIFECSIYHSYCLQAFYRLCRVVFYKKRSLLSHSLYRLLILVQWSWVFVLLIPPLFVDWYVRLPGEFYCLIPYTYVVPEVYHILILYFFPLLCITVTYMWITLYMRQSARPQTLALAVIQRQRNQRDLTVIKRIILIVLILVMLRFPTVIFLLYGIFSGSLYPLTYAVVGLITSACLIIVAGITIYITAQLRKEFVDLLVAPRHRVGVGPQPKGNAPPRR